MKWPKRLLFAFVSIAVLLVPVVWLALPYLNGYQVEGEISLPGLKSKVTVTRDEKAWLISVPRISRMR